jgi:hypothetical protein
LDQGCMEKVRAAKRMYRVSSGGGEQQQQQQQQK